MDERQNKPLNQSKPWSELTEAERQAIRESWKHTLPEKFDVFCIGDLEYSLDNGTTNIPGCLHVSGHMDCHDINVGEDFIVDGYVVCDRLNVRGNFIVDGYVTCWNITISGSSIVGGDVYCLNVNINADFITRNCVDSCEINVGGLFDCYMVDSCGYPIHASDYICRCYEEKS